MIPWAKSHFPWGPKWRRSGPHGIEAFPYRINHMQKIGLGSRFKADTHLRHSFASGAVALGESLPMIGKLLGHTQVQTTARYAHLAADPVKAAAERVAGSIGAVLMR